VAFLAYRSKDGLRFAGSAFFVNINAAEGIYFIYLITAKHVIVKAKTNSTDGRILIRINNNSNTFQFVETRTEDWTFHPDDPSVDLAWAPDAAMFDFVTFPHPAFISDKIIEEERIGVGDEVFMTGLFASHYGKQRNIPIVRIGNIACMPEEQVDTDSFGPIDAFSLSS
jgi:hypothetical protein